MLDGQLGFFVTESKTVFPAVIHNFLCEQPLNRERLFHFIIYLIKHRGGFFAQKIMLLKKSHVFMKSHKVMNKSHVNAPSVKIDKKFLLLPVR